MITGFTKFKEKFQGFEKQYVVIGGFETVLKVITLFLNVVNTVIKIIELRQKKKNRHQKSNRPSQR